MLISILTMSSFVYICLSFIGGTALLGLVPLIVGISMYGHFDKIVKQHSTISAYASDPKTPANRLLLMICTSIGICLTFLYTVEYNTNISLLSSSNTTLSTPMNATINNAANLNITFYIVRIISSVMFPFVGIFYTKGTLMRRKRMHWSDSCSIPIEVSDYIHSICSLIFMMGISISGTVLDVASNNSVAIPVDIAALVFLFSFINIQVIIRLLRRTGDEPSRLLPCLNPGDFQIWVTTKRSTIIHSVSFILELVAFLLIIGSSMLGSVTRGIRL